jgi:hypothetical protein
MHGNDTYKDTTYGQCRGSGSGIRNPVPFFPLEPESLSDNVMGQKYNQKSFNHSFFYLGYLRLQNKVGQQQNFPPSLLVLLLDLRSGIWDR